MEDNANGSTFFVCVDIDDWPGTPAAEVHIVEPPFDSTCVYHWYLLIALDLIQLLIRTSESTRSLVLSYTHNIRAFSCMVLH